jgi:hypothetical protein
MLTRMWIHSIVSGAWLRLVWLTCTILPALFYLIILTAETSGAEAALIPEREKLGVVGGGGGGISGLIFSVLFDRAAPGSFMLTLPSPTSFF